MAARPSTPTAPSPQRIAIIGAGMAGVACARTLLQAGREVVVFEQGSGVGGRMASIDSAFGSFDTGAQYFTVRDPRFERALSTAPEAARRWSASALRVLDGHGQVSSPARQGNEAHWVGAPTMNELLRQWARPLADQGRLRLQTTVKQIARDRLHPERWQLHTDSADGGQQVLAGFDAVLLAIPGPQARDLIEHSGAPAAALAAPLAGIEMAPCWTLLLAYAQAVQPELITLGPQWNAAHSTHHRIAWLARESSKPGRGHIERWTVQASPEWSTEHQGDDPDRIQAKLHRAFVDVTGIHAEPSFVATKGWRHARTTQALGRSHVWDSASQLGLCGDWCLGHRVEDAFVSGLELALSVV